VRFAVPHALIFLAASSTFVACHADASTDPAPPIVIGGDQPESRGTSACNEGFGTEPLATWVARTVHTLCKKGDAESLLAVFLFAAPGVGSQGAPDWMTLDRAYAVGQSNPVVLWTVALNSKCHMPFQASECPRMVTAARQLTQADADNGLAWLTLAYASDQSLGDPTDIGAALDRAAAAPRVHDYGFDLLKLAVTTTGEVAIPDDVRGQATQAQFRLQFLNPFVAPASTVTGWLNRGCNSTNAIPPPAADQCRRAKSLLQRGDSRETLSGDTKAIAQLDADQAATRIKDQATYAKTFIDLIQRSSSEREWMGNMKSHLEGQ